jgi:Cu(I)/Ag(I) efflux system periplasmic protein CusF
MRTARIVVASAVIAFSSVGAAYAQQTLTGEVVTVDELSGKIGVKLSGTVGASDTTSVTNFKVEDGLIFNAVKPGDKVSFTSERVGGEMIIKKLTKD